MYPGERSTSRLLFRRFLDCGRMVSDEGLGNEMASTSLWPVTRELEPSFPGHTRIDTSNVDGFRCTGICSFSGMLRRDCGVHSNFTREGTDTTSGIPSFRNCTFSCRTVTIHLSRRISGRYRLMRRSWRVPHRARLDQVSTRPLGSHASFSNPVTSRSNRGRPSGSVRSSGHQ